MTVVLVSITLLTVRAAAGQCRIKRTLALKATATKRVRVGFTINSRLVKEAQPACSRRRRRREVFDSQRG